MDVFTIGDGPISVLALHGIQGTRDGWVPVARELSAHCRFILPNLRGRGKSARFGTADDYALQAFAGDVKEVALAWLNGSPFVLAGWSMGVSVALEYVARSEGPQPEQLALLSGTPKVCAASWFHGEGEALEREIAAREVRLGLRAAADHRSVALTWQAVRKTDQRPLLAKIRQRTLVIHGRDDEDSPWAHGSELCASLPDAKLVTIDSAGHGILTANTARVAEELRQFVQA